MPYRVKPKTLCGLHKGKVNSHGNDIFSVGEIGIKAAGSESISGDPADRIIAATALQHSLQLMTADKKLLNSGLAVKVVDGGMQGDFGINVGPSRLI